MRIGLPPAAIDALSDLAHCERRDPRGQAEAIIIAELHRLGKVSADGCEATEAGR